MILACNQGKQRGPLHNYQNYLLGVHQRQSSESFLVKYVTPLWSADLKSCEFVCQIHGIRVDGGESEKENVADSKSIWIRVDRA